MTSKWIVKPSGTYIAGNPVFVLRRKLETGKFEFYTKQYTDCGRALRRARILNKIENNSQVSEESSCIPLQVA